MCQQLVTNDFIDTKIIMSKRNPLQSLFAEAVNFSKSDFHFLSYSFTLAYISICIYLNYNTGFYQEVMRKSYFTDNSLWTFPLFYAFMYFSVAIPVLLFQKEYKLLQNKDFYYKSLFFIVLYGLAVGYFGYRNWEFPTLFTVEKQFMFRVLSQLKGGFIIILPLLLLKFTIDKKVNGLYGLARNANHIRGYLAIYAIMLTFLIAISYTSDFMSAYPQFRPWMNEGVFGWPLWLTTLVFETTYSIDFVMTELMFRGALVIGMISIMGRQAILPMVGMYAAIHFGKPVGETISSIFGGYILGVLAYQTRHIWGGVIVHICIALTMEVMGFLHYYAVK